MATEIDRFMVIMDANFKAMEEQLKKAIRANYAAASKIENAWKKTAVGEGVNKTLDGLTRSASAALGPLGGFATGLSKAGAAGLAFAATFGAVAVALNQAKAAIAFSDALEDTANRLHVTTDALQEFRYAARAAGGDEKGADEALESFSETLGKASIGLSKALKPFQELFGKNFTAEDVKRLGSTEDALLRVVDAISKLRSPAEKDAIVKQLGLAGMKQLAEGGVEQLIKFREEAHKAGVVFASDLIVRASGLHDQLETINQKIKVDVTSSFIALGPVIIHLTELLDGVLRGVIQLADAFKKLGDRTDITLRAKLADNEQFRKDTQSGWQYFIPGHPGAGGVRLSKGAQEKILKRLDLEDAQINSELYNRQMGSAARSAWDFAQMKLDAQGKGDAFDVSSKAGEKPEVIPKGGRVIPAGEAKRAFDPITGEIAKSFEDQMTDMWEAFLHGVEHKGIDQLDDSGLTLFNRDQFVKDAEVAAKQADEYEKAMHEATFEGIRGGLEAAADGDFVDYLKSKVRSALFDAAAEGLTNWIRGIAKEQGSGGWLQAGMHLFGFAGGTSFAPGGPALVGERGPEIVNLPRGSSVIPNSALHNAGLGGAGGAGPTIIFDNRGAVIWEQAARQLMAYADRAALSSGANAFGAARRVTPTDLARTSSRRLS